MSEAKRDPRAFYAKPVFSAALYTALFVAGLIPVTLIASDTHFPTPFQPPEEVAAYFRTHPANVRLCAFLQLCSALALATLVGSLVSRLRAGSAAAWVALVGGAMTAVSVATAALLCWALAQPGIADQAGATRVLHLAAFALGGPGYSVPFGAFVGAASLAAPAGALSRGWVRFGVTLGAIGALSTLSLLSPAALFLIPLTRFPGFVWLIAASRRLG